MADEPRDIFEDGPSTSEDTSDSPKVVFNPDEDDKSEVESRHKVDEEESLYADDEVTTHEREHGVKTDDDDETEEGVEDHPHAEHHERAVGSDSVDKTPEELAADISRTVQDAKEARSEIADLEEKAGEIEDKIKELKHKEHKIEMQIETDEERLEEDKKKIAEEAEQARRLVEGETKDDNE